MVMIKRDAELEKTLEQTKDRQVLSEAFVARTQRFVTKLNAWLEQEKSQDKVEIPTVLNHILGLHLKTTPELAEKFRTAFADEIAAMVEEGPLRKVVED